MLRRTVLVTQAPYDQQGARHALEYSRASLATQPASVACIFFYQQGVYNANQLLSPPTDEFNLYQQWCDLHKDFGVRLLVCITASIRRGIISASEANSQNLSQFSLAEPFEQVGLGEFFTLLHDTDRLVQF